MNFIHPDILPPAPEAPPRFKPGDVVRKYGKKVEMTVQSVFPLASGQWRYWVHYRWPAGAAGVTYAKVMDEHELEAK